MRAILAPKAPAKFARCGNIRKRCRRGSTPDRVFLAADHPAAAVRWTAGVDFMAASSAVNWPRENGVKISSLELHARPIARPERRLFSRWQTLHEFLRTAKVVWKICRPDVRCTSGGIQSPSPLRLSRCRLTSWTCVEGFDPHRPPVPRAKTGHRIDPNRRLIGRIDREH